MLTKEEKLNQIRSEYEEGRSYLEPKKTRWSAQLQLLNNLQRGDQNIASTMLFTFLNRVFSNLYSNKMEVKFVPGNDAEMYAAEALNKLAVSDAQEIDKSSIDYDWTWDTCFYGAGYVETIHFDKRRKTMIPTVINPLFFQFDPYFSEVQKWRYYSKWVLKNKHELQMLINAGTIDGVKSVDEIESGVDPYIWTWKIQDEQAKDVNPPATDSIVPSSGIYQILEHYTYFDGKKCAVWTNLSMTKILREKVLELNDDPDHEGESLWPIVRKQIFKEPHLSASISVPDLIEDKHRAWNVLLNLGYTAAKDEVNPIYEYVPDNIQNVSQLFQRQINQHIAVNELGKSIAPMRKSQAMSNSSMAFMNMIKQEGADVIGSALPVPTGAQKGKKTATQDQAAQMAADLNTSLQTKLMAEAENEYWSHWYQRLIHNKAGADEKLIAIVDAMGTTFESIQLSKIKTKYPPRILVVSSKEAEYKETVERRELSQQLPLFQDMMSKPQFALFLKEFWFPKFKTFDAQSIDLVLPKSIDEIKAERENEALANGENVPVDPNDDHQTHLYIHARGKNTPEMWAHRMTHEYALAQQKKKEDAAEKQSEDQPPEQPPGAGGQKANQPPEQVAKKGQTPGQAAVPTPQPQPALQPNKQ